MRAGTGAGTGTIADDGLASWSPFVVRRHERLSEVVSTLSNPPVDPELAKASIDMAMAFVRASNFPRAIEVARSALDNGIVHPRLLDIRAYWLEQQDRDIEALDDLNRAVQLAPDDPQVRNAHGLVLMKLNRRREAIEAFRVLVALAPDKASAHNSLGSARVASGELDEGERCFQKALELDPDFADAWAHLADLERRRGRYKEAKVLCERALALEPNSGQALTTMASVCISLEDFDQAETILREQLIGNSEILPIKRADGFCVFGDLRHAQGRYDEAYYAFLDGNSARYRIFGPRLEPPGSETSLTYAQWLAEEFAKADPSDWSVQTRRSPKDGRDGAIGHVFLIGFPRSGTTVLENILENHPDVVALDERPLLETADKAFMQSTRGLERLTEITPAEIEEQRAIYWQNVRDHGAQVEGKLFLSKQPLDTLKLPLISRLFPDAKILFALRDPRDVVFGCFRRSYQMSPGLTEFVSLERCARYYDVVMQLREIYRRKLDLSWQDIRNEDLIDDFETRMRAVCTFVGIPWNDDLQNYAEQARGRRIATPGSVQIMKGINRDGVGQWRHYAKYMESVIPILMPWVEKFGYVRE